MIIAGGYEYFLIGLINTQTQAMIQYSPLEYSIRPRKVHVNNFVFVFPLFQQRATVARKCGVQ